MGSFLSQDQFFHKTSQKVPMSTVRVFAGNLPFSVTEEQLKTMFSECGTVVSATIITRGTRSLGYGFVEMENLEAADKAVSAMNKKEVDGRTINVEISRPRSVVPKNPMLNVLHRKQRFLLPICRSVLMTLH